MRLGKMGLGDQVEGTEQEAEVLLKEPSKGQFPWFDEFSFSRWSLRSSPAIDRAGGQQIDSAKTVLMSFGLAVAVSWRPPSSCPSSPCRQSLAR